MPEIVNSPPDFDRKTAWRALWALVIGFFMILLDTTIVSTAMPAIMKSLDADISGILWINSAYLLTFAVPLLITGRLGDRFGPRNIYLIGLLIFALASLWCGLSDSLASLTIARAVQGLGAAMISPQAMTLITRLFPYQHRGAAMGLWGAVAGIATLLGPLAGGLLVDSVGWEWIFFINLPIAVLSFIMLLKFVPRLAPQAHSFDWVGVALSALAMFALVFGIQEGDSTNWEPFIGPLSSWHMIVLGVALFAVFIWWQSKTSKEPLVPLRLFKVRNFSLANVAITCMGLTISTMALPMAFFLQNVRGLTPTQSALHDLPDGHRGNFHCPSARKDGQQVNRSNPRSSRVLPDRHRDRSLRIDDARGHCPWTLLIPSAVQGIGSAMIWPSLSLAATKNLTPRDAGAGSGIYNTTRQIGSVLGSALIAVMMEARVSAEILKVQTQGPGAIPEATAVGLGQALLLPGFVAIAAVLVVAFLNVPEKKKAS